MMQFIQEKLEQARNELLDMGLRGNTLLHFRSGAKTLEIVEGVSAQIYDILVEQQKPMTFLPMSVELDKQPQTKLRTKLLADKLDERLLKISTEANTYQQEQGVNILYLAVGFLTWFETKDSTQPRKAPLILIPVSLERASAKERFKISYNQADIGANLTLAAKLHHEFQVELPDFGEELDCEVFLAETAERIKNQPRWQLAKNEIALGFFSFSKFQMYQDLDPKNWPDLLKLLSEHSVLAGLLGGSSHMGQASRTALDNVTNLHATLDHTQLHFVKDADSSQTEAVIAVKRGANLVIQGPPGTGKSQTITNIISESLADGKRVLFVAEKMAALEVVKRRLDECNLGNAVLELHSHKSNKKAVVAEIKRTLDLGAPKVGDRSLDKRRHAHLRQQLDEYCQQVNTPILKSNVSYIQAIGHVIHLKQRLGDYILPEIDFQPMASWDEVAFTEAGLHVQELVERLQVMGIPEKNAFATSKLQEFSPIEQTRVVTQLRDVNDLLVKCFGEAITLANEMSLPTPTTLLDIQSICRAAERALQAPTLSGLTLTADDWQQRDTIYELIRAGAEMSRLRQRREAEVTAEAWQEEWSQVRQVWLTKGQMWRPLRYFSGDFNRAKQKLQKVMKIELPQEIELCVALMDDLIHYQAEAAIYQKHGYLGERLFGAQWQAEQSDWLLLRKLTDWVIQIYQEVGKGEMPKGLLRFLEGGHSLGSWQLRLDELNSRCDLLAIRVKDVLDRLQIHVPHHRNKKVEELPWSVLATTLTRWHDEIGGLHEMTRYNQVVQLLRQKRLYQVADISYSWSFPPEMLLIAFKLAWYQGLVEVTYRERKVLQRDRMEQESLISNFRLIDNQLFHFAQETLAIKLQEQMPKSLQGAGQMAIILKEVNKKRRQLPIRKLIAQAGGLIQQIKPVFMMSPLSVATYLAQGAVDFDLVVFDEASQVKVVDAIGPILRGKQVVVVGDTRQLPPTDFFTKSLELDDEEAEESQTADIESILNMFLARGVPEKMLRWHYRSRHDSLIALSNQEFYEGKLMIFPSPGLNAQAKGLQFNHLPETTYDRGGSRTNLGEAQVVAEAVMRHAQSTPHLTLGVVAFSATQRDAILLEVERLRRQNPSCEPFFNANALEEGFFIKNLENVQGDERDIIYISIGYGRMATGNMSMNFGPINREGGERRLNVLITRARLGMEVFCNFTADDLKTTAASPWGIKALKNFLKFAETGLMETSKETGKQTDSPFEDEVIKAIHSMGYELEPQLGSAGFFIDIAVRDPEKPGRYILAVECDGASYHSSATARDRDRLRQSVLEGLGWRFHRIWSTDWFRNETKEKQRLKEAIQFSIRYYQELESNKSPTTPPITPPHITTRQIERKQTTDNSATQAKVVYALAQGDLGIPPLAEIDKLSLAKVAQAILQVVKIEAPVHIKEVTERIKSAAGYNRSGSKMTQHIAAAVTHGQQRQLFYAENDFLYQNVNKPVTVRDRSNLPAASKKIEFVSDEEIALAITTVTEMAFSLSTEEAISEALALLGFQRATKNVKDKLNGIINRMIAEKKLTLTGEMIALAS